MRWPPHALCRGIHSGILEGDYLPQNWESAIGIREIPCAIPRQFGIGSVLFVQQRGHAERDGRVFFDFLRNTTRVQVTSYN